MCVLHQDDCGLVMCVVPPPHVLHPSIYKASGWQRKDMCYIPRTMRCGMMTQGWYSWMYMGGEDVSFVME